MFPRSLEGTDFTDHQRSFRQIMSNFQDGSGIFAVNSEGKTLPYQAGNQMTKQIRDPKMEESSPFF